VVREMEIRQGRLEVGSVNISLIGTRREETNQLGVEERGELSTREK